MKPYAITVIVYAEHPADAHVRATDPKNWAPKWEWRLMSDDEPISYDVEVTN